jgi:hypothetical protein
MAPKRRLLRCDGTIDEGTVVPKGIVAVGLLTRADLDRLGDQFTQCFPVSEELKFEDLLRAIDDAESALGIARTPQIRPIPEQ